MRSGVRAVCLTAAMGAVVLLTNEARARAQQSAATRASRDTSRFIIHPDNIPAGTGAQRVGSNLVNPLEGNAQAVADGGKLFVSYNCADCHGADGSGAMGPSLQDNRWHFGGTAGEVYQSIYEGRPDGMPAWGGRIDDLTIWRLVSYVRSLGKGKDFSTENFTGKGVERTGH